MERYQVVGHLRLSPEGTVTSYADAQATVKALQRERDFFETAAATANRMRVDTERALDAEREKVKGLAQQVQDQSTANLETMRHTDDMQSRALDAERALAHLQALVRSLPVVETELSDKHRAIHISASISINSEVHGLVDPLKALLDYRRTLDATTPAGGQE